jgi:hypothetical protein
MTWLEPGGEEELRKEMAGAIRRRHSKGGPLERSNKRFHGIDPGNEERSRKNLSHR